MKRASAKGHINDVPYPPSFTAHLQSTTMDRGFSNEETNAILRDIRIELNANLKK